MACDLPMVSVNVYSALSGAHLRTRVFSKLNFHRQFDDLRTVLSTDSNAALSFLVPSPPGAASVDPSRCTVLLPSSLRMAPPGEVYLQLLVFSDSGVVRSLAVLLQRAISEMLAAREESLYCVDVDSLETIYDCLEILNAAVLRRAFLLGTRDIRNPFPKMDLLSPPQLRWGLGLLLVLHYLHSTPLLTSAWASELSHSLQDHWDDHSASGHIMIICADLLELGKLSCGELLERLQVVCGFEDCLSVGCALHTFLSSLDL